MLLDLLNLWSNNLGEHDLLHHLHGTGVDLRETTLNAVDSLAHAEKCNCTKLLLTLFALHDNGFRFVPIAISILGTHGHGFAQGATQTSFFSACGHLRCLSAGSRKIQPV